MRSVTAFAPGRVNLMGEHTDYNGGRCLPIAIPAGITATATATESGEWTFASAQRDDDAWTAYPRGVVRALREGGYDVPPAHVHVDGDLPLGAGLSSSAALECAVAVALLGLGGIELDGAVRRDVVEICRRAETEFVGAPTGGLDQTVVMLAEAGAALLLDFTTGAVEQVPWADGAPEVWVVDTRVSHTLADGQGYAARVAECREAAALLGVRSLSAASADDVAGLPEPLARRTRHVLSENARVDDAAAALRAGDWAGLGALFTASHTSLRDDYEVSCAELDLAVETAVDAGALGARMTGGGFGGSAIALMPDGAGDGVRRAVVSAFASAGLPRPEFFAARPGAGALVTSR